MIDDRQIDGADFRAFMPGERRPDHAQHALQIDVEGVIPFLVGQFGERDLVRDAGIGHDDIDAAALS